MDTILLLCTIQIHIHGGLATFRRLLLSLLSFFFLPDDASSMEGTFIPMGHKIYATCDTKSKECDLTVNYIGLTISTAAYEQIKQRYHAELV